MKGKLENNNRLWVTWETQRRNVTLSKKLNAELVELGVNAANIIRYPYLSVKTLLLVMRRRPRVLFVQNPSLILAALASFIGKISKIHIVIDAHNAGIFPLEGRFNALNNLALTANRFADVVIVSNDNLKEYLVERGVRSVVIPDPIPTISKGLSTSLDRAKFNIVYVCSWSSDEPYAEVIRATDLLDDTIRIYITGKVQEDIIVDSFRDNNKLFLTGYLTNEEYESLLSSCDAVMVLTERENCLLCGAYEGAAVEKPLILSDTIILRSYFDKGAVYTKNSAKEISIAIMNVKDENQRLRSEVKQLKCQCEKVFQERLDVLEDHLSVISQS